MCKWGSTSAVFEKCLSEPQWTDLGSRGLLSHGYVQAHGKCPMKGNWYNKQNYPSIFFFFWSNNFSLANYLLAFPGSRVLWNRALQEEDYLIIVTGQHYILMINVTMIKSKSLKSYKISQELDFQSLTDLWRTQGLGGLTPRAVRNPHLTSDCPKI